MRVRLPDLWLKLEMALALVPPGTPSQRLQNAALASCVRNVGGTASLLNKWKAGDEQLTVTDDIHYMSATLEYLIKIGVERSSPLDHATIRKFAEKSEILILERPLLETFEAFSQALLKVVERRSDFSLRGGADYFVKLLDDLARKHFCDGLDDCTVPGGEIGLLHGSSRDWTREGGERIARQAAKPDLQEVPEGNFIQYLMPPGNADRLVFGFEISISQNLISHKWQDVCNWIAPQFQRANKAQMLLDEPVEDAYAFRAYGEGIYRLQILSVPLDYFANLGRGAIVAPQMPSALLSLISSSPSWPEGYAECMALITYVRRLAGMRTKALNKNSRDGELASIHARPPVELYKLDYRVI